MLEQPAGKDEPAEPLDVQRNHEYVYVGVGVPVQVPIAPVRVCDLVVTPVMVGADVFKGSAPTTPLDAE
jgi:hypothetical protein